VISRPLKLGFLASRNGSSFRAIVQAIEAGKLEAEARLAVSNNAGSGALAFAAEKGIPSLVIPTKADPEAADVRLCRALSAAGVELVVLSGYLRRLGAKTLNEFDNRVLNIHPGPLPDFGGEGLYGRRVHEAVLAAGVGESAISIHLVDAEYDHGPTLARLPVEVQPADTPEALEARVTAQEPAFFVETLQKIARGELAL
jgi:phosphoribosylglycinamide formyltransferase 1